MKKIRYIASALALLVATAAAHAQVYNVHVTQEGAEQPAYTGVNATCVTFSYNDGEPAISFSSGETAGEPQSLSHSIRYNITFGKASSAINSGTGDPAADGDGTVWAGAGSRHAVPTGQEPAIIGPTLVFKLTDDYNTFSLSAQTTAITLVYDGTYYTVNSEGNEKKLSSVQSIYFVDAHRPTAHSAVAPTSTADGNIAYWSCSKCDKYFGDAACTEEIAENSWVRTMVSGTISWDDSDDFDALRPTSVSVNLIRNGELTENSTTATASGNWTFSFTDLTKYNGESTISYSISEPDVEGYTAAKTGNDVTYTHTHEHAFVPVMMEDENPSFVWAEDYSAKLNLKCSNTRCTGTSSVDATVTNEITTMPTASAAGVLTYTATATYGGQTYTGTTTGSVPQLPAEATTISSDTQVANNSVTVINASNTVAEGESAPTITVSADVAANILLTGEATKATVNVNVASGASLNIYGSDGVTIIGNITAEGRLNISMVDVAGAITASGSASSVSMANTNVTNTTGPALAAMNGATLTAGEGRYEGKERAVSAVGATSDINAAAGKQAYGSSNGTLTPFASVGGSMTRQQSGAPTRRATAEEQDYAPDYKTIIVCDPVDSHAEAKFDNNTVSASANATTGLYDHVCDKGCGTTKNDFKVVKDIYTGVDLKVNVTAEAGVYTAAAAIAIRNGESINIPSGVSITVPRENISFERTFTAGKPSTVSLPLAEVNALDGGAYYYFSGPVLENGRITGVNYTQIGTSVTDYNKAYYPLIFIPTGTGISLNDGTSVFTMGSFADASANTTAVSEGWSFIAMNAAKSWQTGDADLGKAYGFAGQAKGDIAVGEFVRVAAGASIAPGRCYLLAPDSYSPAIGRDGAMRSPSELPATLSVYFHNDNESTGIATLDTESGQMSTVEWYDLQGRRIEQPRQGQIMLKDGKKVIRF